MKKYLFVLCLMFSSCFSSKEPKYKEFSSQDKEKIRKDFYECLKYNSLSGKKVSECWKESKDKRSKKK